MRCAFLSMLTRMAACADGAAETVSAAARSEARSEAGSKTPIRMNTPTMATPHGKARMIALDLKESVVSTWFKSRASHRANSKIVNDAGESLNEMRRERLAPGRFLHSGAPQSGEPGIHIHEPFRKGSERNQSDCEYGFRTCRGACHRAGHFGPGPLAPIRNDAG